MRLVIGVTGGIASGKSTASRMLAEKGCHICDADAIARGLLEKGGGAYEDVVRAFPGYTDESGNIRRGELGAYVFSHPQALKLLNSLTHPAIVRAVEADISGMEGIVIIDAPLLIETGLDALCDRIWLVTAKRELRISRAMSRSGLTRAEAEDRINCQLSEEKKAERADAVIDNSGDIDALYAAIDKLLKEAGT